MVTSSSFPTCPMFRVPTVSLVMDLCITYERWGSTSNPSLSGHLHYPTDTDRTLNETVTDKNLRYRPDYNNRPSHSISFMTVISSTSLFLLLLVRTRNEIDRVRTIQLPNSFLFSQNKKRRRSGEISS